MAAVVRDKATADAQQRLRDTDALRTKVEFHNYAVGAFNSGLALADVVTACRSAAQSPVHTTTPEVLAVQRRITEALAEPILSWADLLKVFDGTRTALAVIGHKRKRLRLESWIAPVGVGLFKSLDNSRDCVARAERVFALWLGVATHTEHLVNAVLENFLGERVHVHCSLGLDYLSQTAERLATK